MGTRHAASSGKLAPHAKRSIMHFISYPANTLYVLVENQDMILTQLIDFGKKWRADVVDICDGTSAEKDGSFETMHQFG